MGILNLPEDVISTNRAPTEQEQGKSKHLLDNKEKVTSLTRKISELEAQLRSLNEETSLIVALAPYNHAPSSFCHLPDDVIREIFVSCLETRRNPTMANTEAPVLLTQISSRLRNIALTNPALWSAVHISIIPKVEKELAEEAKSIMRKRADGVREWLHRRSGNLPLRISVYKPFDFSFRLPGEYDPKEIMDILISCCARWSDVTFVCSPDILVRLASLTQSDVPILHSFYHYAGNIDAMSYKSFWPECHMLGAKTLKRYGASFRGINPTEDLASFPVNWANLTHICFPGPSLFRALPEDMLTLARILRQARRLVYGTFSVSSTSIPFDDIHLPYLKELVVFDYGCGSYSSGFRTILALIRAPALKTVGMFNKDPLSTTPTPHIALLRQAPDLQELTIGHSSGLVECLFFCPQLRFLHIKGASLFQEIPDKDDAFLERFVLDNVTQRLCPHLGYFQCDSTLCVSPKSLRRFITRKQGAAVPHSTRWKAVRIVVDYHTIDQPLIDELRLQMAGTGMRLVLTRKERPQFPHKLSNGLPKEKEDWWPELADIWPTMVYDEVVASGPSELPETGLEDYSD